MNKRTKKLILTVASVIMILTFVTSTSSAISDLVAATAAYADELFGFGDAATPTDATPTDADDATPTDATPTDAGESTPTDAEEVTPIDDEEATPADAEETIPTDDEEATPTDAEEVIPTDDDEATPSDAEEVTPADDEKEVPTDTSESGTKTTDKEAGTKTDDTVKPAEKNTESGDNANGYKGIAYKDTGAGSEKSPKTYDGSNALACALVTVLSGAAAVVVLKKKNDLDD